MDQIDRAILRELTADARLPFRELGTRVGLSANAAAARVRRLEADGEILGFTIRVPATSDSPAGAGAPARPGLEVFIDLRLRPDVTYEAFAASRASGAFPELLDAVHLTGSYEHMVHAVVPDAAALDRLVRRLKSDAGVAQTFTRLAMRTPPPTA